MSFENSIFKKAHVNYKKLLLYGFKKDKDNYIYEVNFLNNSFKAIIFFKNNCVSGKIIDLELGEEYTNFRTEMSGEFVNKVRDEYTSILEDIKNNCFDISYFMSDQANRITNYIFDNYSNEPEFLWDDTDAGVFRNSNNKKWYGIIMNIDFSKIDNKNGNVDIINIKLDENEIISLLNKEGFYKAYHMNKKSWITIVLNDTLSDEEIVFLIDKSYNIISKK